MGGFKDDRKGQTSNWSYRQSDTTRWSSTPENNNEKKILNSRIYQKMLFFELKNSNWGVIIYKNTWLYSARKIPHIFFEAPIISPVLVTDGSTFKYDSYHISFTSLFTFSNSF